MASLPTQVFPAPYIHQVPPTGMITFCRLPVLPGGQTVLMSPVVAGQGVAHQLHGANIITTAQIPASNGVLMSPQPIVMAPTLHVARTGLPAIVARGGPKLPDLHKVAALMPPREEGQNPVYGKNRDTLSGRPPRSEHAAEKVVVMEDEDTDENALESSLKENGEDSGELSSQEDVEEEEEEEGSDKRDEGGDEEEEKMKENDIDHGDVVTFETEVSSGSESEDEAPPQIKTATRHPPPTTSTAPRLPSNGVVVTSPGATVILPQQPYAIPSMFLSGNRYQVVVPGGVHSNGAIESNQVMQVFNRMGVEPYQVKVVSVDAMSPVIEKEKNKQGVAKFIEGTYLKE